MSSKYVRDTFKNWLVAAFPTERVVDVTARFEDIYDMLALNSVGPTQSWLGVQFTGNPETPITVGVGNGHGCFREVGSIFLHIVEPTVEGCVDNILVRSDTLINIFRGLRIVDLVILELVPPNFGTGTTLDFEAGFTSATIILGYQRDFRK